MTIINRNLDQGGQRDVYDESLVATVTGATYLLCTVPYNAQIVAAFQAAIGLSGAPVHSLAVSRFVVGAGTTLLPLGATLTTSAYGTSGGQGFSLTLGGTLTPLLAGDLILLNTSGANTACAQLTVTLVLKCLQDYKTHYGI